MVNRIFTFIESQQLTPTEFADKIGVSRASISSIKTGRTQPTLSLVDKILEQFPDVDINWLIRGIGEAPIKKESDVNSDSPIEKTEEEVKNTATSVTDGYEAVYIAEMPSKPAEINKESVQPAEQTKKNGKVIKKVILLYDDGSFEEFNK